VAHLLHHLITIPEVAQEIANTTSAGIACSTNNVGLFKGQDMKRHEQKYSVFESNKK